MGKNILVIGSGGREHAICWKLKTSPQLETLTCAPGNAGIAGVAKCVDLPEHKDVLRFCRDMRIDLVVIGPEQPLVEGLSDLLRTQGIAVFGPSQAAARLEGSKAFTKALCEKYHIPTAAYRAFTDADAAHAYAANQSFPLVIKADGLAAGKGVIIAQNSAEAARAIDDMFAGNFGAAGSTVVIEEFLEGREISFFALCDGSHVLEFAAAQDHKRAYDGDKGPNTGGMGAYSPPPAATPELCRQVMESIIRPTVEAMKKEGCPFQGVLFAGLMLTKDGPKLLEYNARFGDPETQAMLMRMESDLLPLLEACAHGRLAEAKPPVFYQEASVCVVMAAKGYPGAYAKGSIIAGLEAAEHTGAVVFHAGTAREANNIIANGGRVLGVTALGKSIDAARSNAYAAIDHIEWAQGFCRRDIAAITGSS